MQEDQICPLVKHRTCSPAGKVTDILRLILTRPEFYRQNLLYKTLQHKISRKSEHSWYIETDRLTDTKKWVFAALKRRLKTEGVGCNSKGVFLINSCGFQNSFD